MGDIWEFFIVFGLLRVGGSGIVCLFSFLFFFSSPFCDGVNSLGILEFESPTHNCSFDFDSSLFIISACALGSLADTSPVVTPTSWNLFRERYAAQAACWLPGTADKILPVFKVNTP